MSNKKDFATSTVVTAPSPADSGTSLVVQSGHGARFPAAPFYITAHPPSEFPTLDNAEKILVTAKSTDTFTIDRAEGDTTAKEIEAGWRVSNALFLDDIPDTFDDLADGSTNKAFTGTLKTKLDGIETAADVTDATNVDAAGATMNSDTNVKTNSWVKDEDNMSSNDDTKVPTQQSVKAYVDSAITAAKQALLPVGSIVVLGVSTNPNTLYGFGTWTAIAGKVLVGIDGSQTEFDTLDETGGHKLTQAHTHTRGTMEITGSLITNWTDNSGGGMIIGYPTGVGALYASNNGTSRFSTATGNGAQANQINMEASRNWTGATSSYGGGNAENLQPYIVKYMWQRTA